MKSHRKSTRSRPRVVGAITLSALAVTACATLRYPSLGIDGIQRDNAPYVNQRILTLQEEIQSVARDSWSNAVGVALADEQPECGVASYDGPVGEMAAGATVTVQIDECLTGVPVERIEVTFQNGEAGAAPTPEAFRARVRYLGIRSNWIGMDASFVLDFSSEGGSDPLLADHTAATWRIQPASGAPFLIHSLLGKRAELEGISCEMNELRSDTASLDTSGCDFTMLDGADAAPMLVSTPTLFKTRVRDVATHPYEGVLRIQDMDGAETVLDAGAVSGDSVLLRTFAADGTEAEQAVMTWDELGIAVLPTVQSGSEASSEADGWL